MSAGDSLRQIGRDMQRAGEQMSTAGQAVVAQVAQQVESEVKDERRGIVTTLSGSMSAQVRGPGVGGVDMDNAANNLANGVANVAARKAIGL